MGPGARMAEPGDALEPLLTIALLSSIVVLSLILSRMPLVGTAVRAVLARLGTDGESSSAPPAPDSDRV